MEEKKRQFEIKSIDDEKFTLKNILLYSSSVSSLITLAAVLLMSFIIPQWIHSNELKRNDLNEKIKALEFFSKSFTEQVNFYNAYRHNLCKSINEQDPEHKKFLRERAYKYFERAIESPYSYEIGVSMIKIHFPKHINQLGLDEYGEKLNNLFVNENKETIGLNVVVQT